MPGKNAYARFIEHLGSWVFNLPDSEFLIGLLEATLTPEKAEFLSDFPFLPHTIEELAERFNQPVNELQSKDEQDFPDDVRELTERRAKERGKKVYA